MKKPILLIIAFFLLGCDKNCDQQYNKLNSDYQEAINNCGGNAIAIQQVVLQYNSKRAELDKQCD